MPLNYGGGPNTGTAVLLTALFDVEEFLSI